MKYNNYNLICTHIMYDKIYNILENNELSKKILNSNSRVEAVNSIKNILTGIYKRK